MRSSVVVIAAEPDARDHLVALLSARDFVVVADGWDPMDVAASSDAAVVVCPATDPAPLLRETAQTLPNAHIIAVLPTVSRHSVRRTIRAGACAIVSLESVDTTLVVAIQSACAGQLSIPLDFSDEVEKPILSSREKQILGMVVMGFTNGQVARRLYLAESTVKSHMSSIFGKLGVCSRKEAAALVLDPEQGLGMGILSISDDPVGTDLLAGPRDKAAA